ncbi:hypothetical protein Ancab_031729 [Ancistrocladus abbreviatus]
MEKILFCLMNKVSNGKPAFWNEASLAKQIWAVADNADKFDKAVAPLPSKRGWCLASTEKELTLNWTEPLLFSDHYEQILKNFSRKISLDQADAYKLTYGRYIGRCAFGTMDHA